MFTGRSPTHRVRAIDSRYTARAGPQRTIGSLVALRGRDADNLLRQQIASRTRVRPMLGALAVALLEPGVVDALGFRSIGDWSREQIGVGARTVREWARVWRALGALPYLRGAVESGEVSWTVARRVVGLVTPEEDAACLDTVRGRTVAAVDAILRSIRDPPTRPDMPEGPEQDEHTTVRLRCGPRVLTRWMQALELARRMAGERLPIWECAEYIAAEGLSASPRSRSRRADPPMVVCQPPPSRASKPIESARESGIQVHQWPALDWSAPLAPGCGNAPSCHAQPGVDGTPREIDRRFRSAIAFRQQVDFEIGRLLRQIVDRRLHVELGFSSFDRYVVERLAISPRTARRLVRIARAEHHAPQVANAFRCGRLTMLQSEVLLRMGSSDVESAERITLRRLEDGERCAQIRFSAPRDVATLFEAVVGTLGLEATLDHAIETWIRAGTAFRDYADFERDGWRCTVPGCTARRSLQSHHIRFRSAGGPDVPSNRTTLCATHHLRGVHGGHVRIAGRAPDRLVFELGVGRFASGDVRLGQS